MEHRKMQKNETPFADFTYNLRTELKTRISNIKRIHLLRKTASSPLISRSIHRIHNHQQFNKDDGIHPLIIKSNQLGEL